GFFEMIAQALAEIAIGCLVDHLGQRFYDLMFCVIDVLQAMNEQVVHCLNVLGEETHGSSLACLRPELRRLNVWSFLRFLGRVAAVIMSNDVASAPLQLKTPTGVRAQDRFRPT